MRGGALVIKRRFIPAYAGNGHRISRHRHTRAVHPRVCRERVSIMFCSTRIAGSSPRMQGTGRRRALCHRRVRFIPAYAGNGRERGSDRNHRSVHPRVCRERHFDGSSSAEKIGSSPRMQGTDSDLATFSRGFRFIPAYAGNGHKLKATLESLTVHPRVCRERERSSKNKDSNAGSSPRMQGTAQRRQFTRDP